jgi:beta-mannosidase
VACTSSVDYHAQPKPVYYAVKRAYAPVLISARFASQVWADRQEFEAAVWANNSGSEPLDGDLRVRLIGASGRVYGEESSPAHVPGATASEVRALRWPLDQMEEDVFFLDLSLSSGAGAEARYLFSRTPDLSAMWALGATELAVTHEQVGGEWRVSIANTGNTAALPLWLEDARPPDVSGARRSPGYLYFDDNYFTLLPGESRTLTLTWEAVPERARRVRLTGWNVAPQVITRAQRQKRKS